MQMRRLLQVHSSTRAERRFAELLKKLHIPFEYRVKIGRREVDFIIGRYAIDIDGHEQDVNKNVMLITKGYNPIHFSNSATKSPNLEEWLKQIYYGLNSNRYNSGDRFSGSSSNN